MLAAGGDQLATIWDVTQPSSPERIVQAFRVAVNDPMTPYAHVRDVAFSPDGQQLLIIADTFSANYAVTLQDINQASWQTAACSIANRNFTLSEWQQFVGNAPYQKVCTNFPVDSTVTQDELKQAHADVLAGQTGDAQAIYKQAMQEAALVDDDFLNGSVCFAGSTDQFASVVLPACERAITLNPYIGDYYDSRGLARALTGNRQGAIADFKFYVQWATTQAQYNKHLVDERNGWIQKLEAGQNPFDAKTLQALRVEAGIDL